MLRCADVAQGEAAISLFFRHAAREEFDVELLKGERERIDKSAIPTTKRNGCEGIVSW